ncbi:MAG: Ldh family oxidoreductase [Alphaproteobacteria bacterium]|nr:Ldh family oxidoreductase [Alphaproteobacteria bacterium]
MQDELCAQLAQINYKHIFRYESVGQEVMQMETVTLTLNDMYGLALRVLVRSGTSEANAGHVATALSVAEADGLSGHGLSRLPSYAAQVRSGKVSGGATPVASEDPNKAVVRINAKDGFAFPAISMAIENLVPLTRKHGIAAAAIAHSHHCGALGYHVERLAEQRLVGIMFANSPAAIAPWGGSKALFGTNPIAFAAPRNTGTPLVIDLSLSKVARGKIMVAAQKDEPIPEGWAVDSAGRPTTDARAAMEGTMLPMGDAKGSALVLMVEILAATLTGASYGYEASSFFDAEGTPPRVGQTLIAIDPDATVDIFTGNAFGGRMETLISQIRMQPGTHVPGANREARRREARYNGVSIPAELHQQLTMLAGG